MITFTNRPIYTMIGRFQRHLDDVLNERTKPDEDNPTVAVAVTQYRDRWLLGLAKSTGDDRTGKWCMPGGHIKRNETPEQAAVRECREETGVTCKSVGKYFTLPQKPRVAFVHCRVHNRQDLQANCEFSALGFFTVADMQSLKLYPNVMQLIQRVKR